MRKATLSLSLIAAAFLLSGCQSVCGFARYGGTQDCRYFAPWDREGVTDAHIDLALKASKWLKQYNQRYPND